MAALWPSEAALPGFKASALRFMRRMHAVVETLMGAFAIALGLEEDHFTRHMSPDDDDNGSALFFNKYPSLEGVACAPGATRIWVRACTQMLQRSAAPRSGTA